MAQVLDVPIFSPQDVAHMTNDEWNDYRNEVTAWIQNENALLVAVDPHTQFPAAPPVYINNPAVPTQ